MASSQNNVAPETEKPLEEYDDSEASALDENYTIRSFDLTEIYDQVVEIHKDAEMPVLTNVEGIKYLPESEFEDDGLRELNNVLEGEEDDMVVAFGFTGEEVSKYHSELNDNEWYNNPGDINGEMLVGASTYRGALNTMGIGDVSEKVLCVDETPYEVMHIK